MSDLSLQARLKVEVEPWRKVLERAADHMERIGKCEGALERHGSVCTAGAISFAVHGSAHSAVCTEAEARAYAQLEKHLGCSIFAIPEWSDRTPAAEVIETLRTVARS
jgi:hypothetical protein